MKQADIYYKNQLAGLLTEDEEGYHFAYACYYLDSFELGKGFSEGYA